MHRVALLAMIIVSFISFTPADLSAWTAPPASPPNSNVAAPVNVGANPQTKNGTLGMNGLAVFGNSILQASSYLNWGVTSGSTGYGIRDNAGTLEFRNSGAPTWQSLQAFVAGLGTATQWTTNGTSIYYNGGNVGVGVVAPGAKLEVNNAIKFTNSAADTNDGKIGTALFAAGLNIIGINTDAIGRKINFWGSFIQNENPTGNVFTGNTSFPGSGIWNASGNVGIGTASPVEKLDIVNGSGRVTGSGDIGSAFWTINESKVLSNQAYKSGFYNMTGAYGDKFAFYAYSKTGACAGGLCMNPFSIYDDGHIYMAGNVGIGTLSPTQALDVAGNVTASLYYDRGDTTYYLDPNGISRLNDIRPNIMYDGQDTTYYSDPNGVSRLNDIRPNIMYDGQDTAYYSDPNATSNLNLVYANDLRPAIMYDKNDTSYYVDPNGSTVLQYGEIKNGVEPTLNFHRPGLYATGIKLKSDNKLWFGGWSAGEGLASLVVGQIQGTSFLYWSDRRMKENVTPINNALWKLLQIEGVNFVWKSGSQKGKHDVGVIAQDVEKVLPEAVNTDKDGMKSVDYPRLIPLLIGAIKEQQNEIDELKAAVKALQEK